MFYWVLPSFSGRCWVTRNLILLESYEGFLFFFFYKPDMGKERNAIGGSWPPLIGGNSAKLLANQVEQLGRIHQVGESRVETRVFAYLRVDVVLFCLFVCLLFLFANVSRTGPLPVGSVSSMLLPSFFFLFFCVCVVSLVLFSGSLVTALVRLPSCSLFCLLLLLLLLLLLREGWAGDPLRDLLPKCNDDGVHLGDWLKMRSRCLG